MGPQGRPPAVFFPAGDPGAGAAGGDEAMPLDRVRLDEGADGRRISLQPVLHAGYGPEFEYVDSADPNDHYRPWMEQHVGKQGWDWNWGMADRDATDNRLTIKIRQRHAKYATLAAIKWS